MIGRQEGLRPFTTSTDYDRSRAFTVTTLSKACPIIVAMISLCSVGAMAETGALGIQRAEDRGTLETIHEGEHAVDHAWEVYHRAALGGTLASPALQAEIELHLHEARTLLPKAQAAAERQNSVQLEALLAAIRLHTKQAIEGSMEQKQ